MARTLLVSLLFLGIGFGKREFYSVGFVFLGGFLTPRLLRNLLVSHLKTSFAVLRYFGMAIFALAAVAQSFRESLPEVALIHGVSGVIGLYLGLYFWLLSDPEVKVFTH